MTAPLDILERLRDHWAAKGLDTGGRLPEAHSSRSWSAGWRVIMGSSFRRVAQSESMRKELIAVVVTCCILEMVAARAPDDHFRTPSSVMARDTTQTLRMSSFESTYPLAGALFGMVSVHDDSLVVRIDSGVVQNRMPVLPSGTTVVDSVELRAGIGWAEGESWRVDTLGAPLPVSSTLLPASGSEWRTGASSSRGQKPGRWSADG